jgi:hypothetical protein
MFALDDGEMFPQDDAETYIPDDGGTFPPEDGETYIPDDGGTFPPDGDETYIPDDDYGPEQRSATAPGRGWRWWTLWIVGLLELASLVAVGVYVVSDHLAATYQSSAIVQVSVQATDGISDPSVTAANDLASQFAQLASTAPVVSAAQAKLGDQGENLSGSVSAGTIAAQNLIRISVTGSSPALAQTRTTAVAAAFVTYVRRLNAKQAASYVGAVTAKLRPLDREIAAARKRLTNANAVVQREATVLLSGLLSEQQSVLSSVAQSSASAQPYLQLVAPGGGATKVSPKPVLYAAVGFLAVLLLLGRLLYYVGVRTPNGGVEARV